MNSNESFVTIIISLLLLLSSCVADDSHHKVKAIGSGEYPLGEYDNIPIIISCPTPDFNRITDIKKELNWDDQNTFDAWKETIGLSGDFKVLHYNEIHNDTDVVEARDGSRAYGRILGDVIIEIDLSSDFLNCLQTDQEEVIVASLVRTLLCNNGGPYKEKSKVYITIEEAPFITSNHDFSGPLMLEQFQMYWSG